VPPVHNIPAHDSIGRVANNALRRNTKKNISVFVMRSSLVLPRPILDHPATPTRPPFAFVEVTIVDESQDWRSGKAHDFGFQKWCDDVRKSCEFGFAHISEKIDRFVDEYEDERRKRCCTPM
jgi:hypothetical protein